MHRHEVFRRTLLTILTCLLGAGTGSMALANACSIVVINDGELDMLGVGDAITLAEQCHEAGNPLPDDPCDVRLFYRPGGLIVNLKTSQAEYAEEREMLRACVQDRMAALDTMTQIQRDLLTPLHDAITSDTEKETITQILAETGSRYINTADTEGRTPLHALMEHGADPEVTALLLDAGADPMQIVDDAWPVLFNALHNNAPRATLSLLIAAGADPGQTVINNDAIGSLYRETNVVSMALRSGYSLADLQWIYAQSGFGTIPYRRSFYHYAAIHEDPDALNFLSEISEHPNDSREATEILFYAARNDAHPQAIAKLFALGADGTRDDLHHSNGRTVLHYMIYHPQDLRTIRALIEGGATMGSYHSMADMFAIAARRHPDPELLRYLAAWNAQHGLRTNLRSAIGIAAGSGENAAEKVAALHALGLDALLTCQTNCPTLLDAIADDRSVEDMGKIVAAGYDIHATDGQGNGVLHAAIAQRNLPEGMFEFLIAAGADVDLRNEYGDAPLFKAIARGTDGFEMVNTLLDHGADPNILAADGTPLLSKIMAHSGALEMIRTAIDAGMDPTAVDNFGRAPISILVSKPWTASTQAYLFELLRHPHDVAKIDANGDTALYHALKSAHPRDLFPAIVAAFLAAGYDPNLVDDSGATALHHAISRGHDPETITALLDAGADPHQTNADGLDPLQLALVNERPDPIPAVLLAQGIDPNSVDADGMRPLHLAAMHGAENATFAALLTHGADPQMRTPEGVLPIQLIKANQQMDPENYQAIRKTLRDGGGGTHLIRELHLNGWTPWIIAGFGVLLALGYVLWRMTRPVRIV